MRAPLPAPLRRSPPVVRLVTRLAGSIIGVLTDEPVFGLTFDDGPDPENTPSVLSCLAERRANATFFLLGRQAAKHPALVAEVLAAGHEVALHGGDHFDLTQSNPARVVDAVHRARGRLEELAGRSVRWFRPPYGAQGPLAYTVARLSGMQVVGWSASSRDSLALDENRQVAIAYEELGTGGILLMHDGPPPAPKRRTRMVARVLDVAEQRGWQATSVEQLLSGRERVLRPWFQGRLRTLTEALGPFAVASEAEGNPEHFALEGPA